MTRVKFRPAHLSEYLAWLEIYLAVGGRPTHLYPYPWSRWGFLTATADFYLGGECGSDARSIIVPDGIGMLGGGLGHNNIYFMPPPQVNPHEFDYRLIGTSVPIFSDPDFSLLPIDDFVRQAQFDEREWQRERESREAARRIRLAGSDLARYLDIHHPKVTQWLG